MEDAAGFFANVFGGERFVEYVSPPLPHIDEATLCPTSDRRNLNHERHDICGFDHDD
jgi:hypothetical protein